MDDLSKIIETVCLDCKATNGEGQLVMLWSILWWFVNRSNGGAISSSMPGYRGCYPAACTKSDVMTNSHQLGELYGVAGMRIVGVLEFPAEAPLPLPGCSSDKIYNKENCVGGNYVAVATFSALGLLLLASTLYDVYLRSTAENSLPENNQENVGEGNKYLLSFSIL